MRWVANQSALSKGDEIERHSDRMFQQLDPGSDEEDGQQDDADHLPPIVKPALGAFGKKTYPTARSIGIV